MRSTAAPEVRAAHLKTLLAALPALGAGPARAVLERLEPATRRRTIATSALGWLPVSVLVELCATVQEVAGDAALEAWGAAALEGVLRSPLARAFYEAALLLERRDPAVVVTFLLKAWPLLYSGCGEVVVTDRQPGLVRLVHADVPEPLRCAATVLPLIGGLAAIPGHCGKPGRGVADWHPGTSVFHYTLRWDAP